MSDDIFKRLLEEQQAIIDVLRLDLDRKDKQVRALNKGFSDYYNKRDVFFKHLNRLVDGTSCNKIDPSSPDWSEWKHEVRMHMIDCGWCFNCESTMCFGDCREEM